MEERRLINEHVQDMLRKNIITESSSEWSAPVLLLRKPDGTFRLCIDYRRLNEIIKKDRFPMPRLDEIFSLLYGAKYFTGLDMANAFHQISIDPADKVKTAFCTPQGLYQYNRMPQGLATSPALLNRILRKVLSGILYKSCFQYLDDLLVYSNTFAEHLQHLEQVFEKLQHYGFKLKASKCTFAQHKVRLLGHLVSSDGITVDDDKIDAIKKIPIPSNREQLEFVLGLAGFYRRLIPDFSAISKPLIHLAKLDVPYYWDHKCQIAFD